MPCKNSVISNSISSAVFPPTLGKKTMHIANYNLKSLMGIFGFEEGVGHLFV